MLKSYVAIYDYGTGNEVVHSAHASHAAAETATFGEDGISIIEMIHFEVLRKIYRVAHGEDQVADDDTEGMAWIADFADEQLEEPDTGQSSTFHRFLAFHAAVLVNCGALTPSRAGLAQ
jgi:hypothetical protein